jgi:hypothetical protein
MHNDFTITLEDGYVQVLSEGEKDYEFAEKLWTAVVAFCKQHNCYQILGISNTSRPMEAVDGYDHARLFRDLGISHEYRIAWVELREDAKDMTAFIETVLVNRGLPGRLFSSVQEAKDWLLHDGDTS